MLNQNLIDEVLRLRDAASMFPREKKSERHLSVLPAVMPPDRPNSHAEWILHITESMMEKKSYWPYIQSIKPVEAQLPAKREKLTAEHIAILKALSFRPGRPLAAFARAA